MATKRVIKFFATWCGPCKVYGKTWDKVTSAYSSISFQDVDIDKDTEGLAAKYKVMTVPTTVALYEDGTVKKEEGRLSAQELTNLIEL